MQRSTVFFIVACLGVGALTLLVVMLRSLPPLVVATPSPAAPSQPTLISAAPAPTFSEAAPSTPTAPPPPARAKPSLAAVMARMREAISARDWSAADQAERTLGDPPSVTPTDAFLVDQLRDDVRRGRQRDRDGVIEFRNQQGMIQELLPELSPLPTYVGDVAAKVSLALNAEQQLRLLVFTPRGALTTATAVSELVADLRLLRIEGLTLINECAIDPSLLTALAGAPLRALSGSAIAKIPAAVWANLPRLERLDLRQHAGSAPQPFAALAGHATLTQLSTSSQAPLGAEDVRCIATLSALQDLTLWGGALAPADLVPLGGLHALRRLELINQRADELLCAALAAGAPGLEEIYCSNLRLGGTAIPALARIPMLRSLHLGDIEGAAHLSALATLTGLRSLHCSTSPRPGPDGQTPEAFDFASWSSLTVLEELQLGIPANAICDIRGLEGLAVKSLFLMGSGIGNRHVTDLRRMPRLEVLRLASTSIDDAGAAQLAGAQHLRKLNFFGNPTVTGSCLPVLLAAPDLRSLRLDSSRLDEAVVLTCSNAGRLEHFSYRGAKRPSSALVTHVAAWPGAVQVDLDITGMAPSDQERMRAGNARRQALVPVPTPDNGF